MSRLRSGRLFLFIALTLLLVIPLYHLRDVAAQGSYKNALFEQLHIFVDQESSNGSRGSLHNQSNDDADPTNRQCQNFPDTSGILLVMKTGATEAYEKLPTQLLTHMKCLPDFLLFSDAEQYIGGHRIHNALQDVKPEVMQDKHEFDLYRAQQSCPVSTNQCTSQLDGGWDLDKYKFMHIVEMTWRMRPGMDWYVFAEADTYVFWPNLVHYLHERAKPRDHLYVGSAAMYDGRYFAHGGSGYVISGPLLKKLAEVPDLAAKWDMQARHECCGDYVLALAMEEVSAKVKQAHPHFNGEKPNTLPYGPGHWCEPIFTMHHMNSEEVSSVWQYEQTREDKESLVQIREMYHRFFEPHLIPRRDNWDNYANDMCYLAPDEHSDRGGQWDPIPERSDAEKNPIERHAHTSPEACALVCEAEGLDISASDLADAASTEDRAALVRVKFEEKMAGGGGSRNARFAKKRECFQWRYRDGECCTGKTFSLGQPTPRREDEDGGEERSWTSGWFVEGINDWIDAKGVCRSLEWRDSS